MEEKTNYQLSASVNEGMAETVITGEITEDTIDQLHNDVLALLKKRQPKALLIDISTLEGRYDDVSAAFFRTRSLPPDVIRLPAAVVDPKSGADFVSFYETTAANMGQTVKWFADIEATKTWLNCQI
jgi:hypothetical protein